MTFQSILFREPADDPGTGNQQWTEYSRDLNLDQIIAKILIGREEYELAPLFERPLKRREAIFHRHQVMRDLENPPVLLRINVFAEQMRSMRQQLERESKLHYLYQKQRWFVHAVETYRVAATELAAALDGLELSSPGLRAFRDYLHDYVRSERFGALVAASDRAIQQLRGIHYSVLIRGGGFKVRRFESEHDYSIEVAEVFAKFQQGDVKDYRVDFPRAVEMNHIEAKVLEFVALLYPEAFAGLDAFCREHKDYLDPTLARFDREIQFYIAYLEYVSSFKRTGMHFCYPDVSSETKEISCTDAFDLALASKLVAVPAPVVCNSFFLNDPERIFVVSGPNQGGKTTFARMFGQLHHLASLGCPVPGSAARLFLFDVIYTHFEREENIANLHGKLQDDLVRIHSILREATPDSIIIMNEIFTSTTLSDAIFLARKVVDRVVEIDCLCVCVTFLDELASLGVKTVSMTSTVEPEDPTLRTYKLVRRVADGRAYAISLAEKYRLTYERLKGRIPTVTATPSSGNPGESSPPIRRHARIS